MKLEPEVRRLRIALFLLGTTSIAVQILLLREFISLSQGNELVIGVILAQWMVLTGIGALVGRLRRMPSPAIALVLVSVLPLIIVILVRYLRNILFTAGSIIGLGQVSALSTLLLAPFCLVSGIGFVRCIAAMHDLRVPRPGASAYTWESVGSVAGGLVFNILLIRVIDTVAALSILAATDLCAAILLFLPARQRAMKAILLLPVIGIAFVGACTLDHVTMTWLFPGQDLLYSRGTPYGTLSVTRQQEQLNFYEDNVLAFSTGDPMRNEESVHFVMAQHPRPERVLLIGGGISGTTGEIFKYPVEHLDYIEHNPWILQLGRKYTANLDDGRIHTLLDDGRLYVRHTDQRYDVVIVNLPDPSTMQLNRFYSLDCFFEIRSLLHPGGIFSLSLLPAAEYGGDQSRKIQSTVFSSLHKVFPHVRILPGIRNVFIASDSSLDGHIAALIAARHIQTDYVNGYYIDDQLLEDRSKTIEAGLDPSAPPNTDFRPLCYSQQLAYWSSYFGFDPVPWLTGAAGVVMVVLYWRTRPFGSVVLTSGFTASSIELVLLTCFQALYGSLYEMTGMIITTFMAGLALGSYIARERVHHASRERLLEGQAIAIMVCAILPFLITAIRRIDPISWVGELLFVAVTFVVAGCTGWVFSIAVSLDRASETSQAASLYGTDLVGSSAGALLTGLCIIPSLGVMNASYVASAVSAAGFVLCMVSRRGISPSEEVYAGTT